MAAARILGEAALEAGTAGVGLVGRGLKAADHVLTPTARGRGRSAEILGILDEFPVAQRAVKAIGLHAANYRSAKEVAAIARIAMREGNVAPDVLRAADEFARTTGTLEERSGLFHGYIRMHNQGWMYGGVAKYGANHGLDGIFFRIDASGKKEFAILEAKSGGGLSSLATDEKEGLRQGTRAYIKNRLTRAIQVARDPAVKAELEQVLKAMDNPGELRSFASIAPSAASARPVDKLIEIPPLWKGGKVSNAQIRPWIKKNGIYL